MSVEEELQILEHKLNALKLDYERYFLGTRPREPAMARGEIQKAMIIFSNTPIQNTALRFKFNSINSRFLAYRRQWDNTLRQMEAGTYKRDVFKAKLHERTRDEARASKKRSGGESGRGSLSAGAGGELFDAYVSAAEACGQKTAGLTPQKLQAVVTKQTAALRKKLGCEDVRFRVVVQGGKVVLKAAAVRP